MNAVLGIFFIQLLSNWTMCSTNTYTIFNTCTIFPKNAAVLKTLRFYESCLNTTAANALGLQSIKHLVQEYGGWSVSSNIDPNVPLTTRMGKVLRELNVATLLDIKVKNDPLNHTKKVLSVSVIFLDGYRSCSETEQSLPAHSKTNDLFYSLKAPNSSPWLPREIYLSIR